MGSKQALKSKKSSTGDRFNRMQRVLRDSETGDQALPKYACHFNYNSNQMNALRTIGEIFEIRDQQRKGTETELLSFLVAAFCQRHRILKIEPNSKGNERLRAET
jgi:hypothetical protein